MIYEFHPDAEEEFIEAAPTMSETFRVLANASLVRCTMQSSNS